MKQLALDLIELIDVFEMGFSELTHYLDTETGKVVMVREETRFDLDALSREAHESGSDEEPDLVAIIEAQDIPDWQKEAMLDAYGVEVGTGRRYIEIPQDDTREAYRDMERFISTVQDERLQSLLWRAIDGLGAFRMFKDILREYPQERERWFDFKDDLVRQRVLGWLAAEGIEPLEP